MQSHVFALCPNSHFAHEQFRNRTAQSKNSYFARQSENSHFVQDISGIVPSLTLRRTDTRSLTDLAMCGSYLYLKTLTHSSWDICLWVVYPFFTGCMFTPIFQRSLEESG